MSLSEKAKTLMLDLKTIFKTSGLGTRNLLFKDVFEYCKNNLKDAQQEIDKLKNDCKEKSEGYAKVCARLHEHVMDLEREGGEQKQELRDFWVSHIEPLDHQLERPWFFTMTFTKEEKEKIEELLKE